MRRFAFLLFLLSTHVHADEASPILSQLLSGWSITPMVGVRLIDLDVKRASDGQQATITNDGSFTGPMYVGINIESPTLLLGDNVGVTVRAHASNFRLTTQRVSPDATPTGEELSDVGTSVSGYYSYLAPIVFYRIAGPKLESRLGVGVGYWKTWFSGDVILAPDKLAFERMPTTHVDGATSTTPGIFLLWTVRGKNGVFELSASRAELSAPGFNYQLKEMNAMLGYTLHF